jgi:hypothetical protein
MESTRDALRSLVIVTLNDPTTRTQVSRLVKDSLAVLLADPTTHRQVVVLVQRTLADPMTRRSVLVLLEDILKDDSTRQNVSQLLATTFVQPPVKQTVSSTLSDAVHDVLSRADVQNHAKQFVATVVQDQTVQAQSGDAIWSTVCYAVTPSWLSWIWQKNLDQVDTVAMTAAAAAAIVHDSETVLETGPVAPPLPPLEPVVDTDKGTSHPMQRRTTSQLLQAIGRRVSGPSPPETHQTVDSDGRRDHRTVDDSFPEPSSGFL